MYKKMMELLCLLPSLLLGKRDEISLENRIFNGISFVTFTAYILAAIITHISRLHILIYIFAFLSIIFSFVLYVASRFKANSYKKLSFPFLFYNTICLTVVWFYNGGLRGSIPVFFLTILTISIIILKKPKRSIYISILLLLFAGIVSFEYFYPGSIVEYKSRSSAFIDILSSLFLSFFMTGIIVYIVFSEYLRERAALQKSLKEIKTLKGLLPICANCKKIRDSKGSWNQMEKYISEHSEAEFSHGICDNCAKDLLGMTDIAEM